MRRRSRYSRRLVHLYRSRRAVRWLSACHLALTLALTLALSTPARRAWAEVDTHPEVTVAVLRDAAPFSFQAPDGTWKGLAVEMWSMVAKHLHLDSRFTGMNRSELIDAISTGQARFGIGALSITAQRLHRVDFSAPVHVP